MVFKKKIIKNNTEEPPLDTIPNANEIEVEREDIEEDNVESVSDKNESIDLAGEQDNGLQVLLEQLQNRIISIEATLYRLLNR